MRVGALEKHVECCLAAKEGHSSNFTTASKGAKEIGGDMANVSSLPGSCISTNVSPVRRVRIGDSSITLEDTRTGQGGTPLNNELKGVRRGNNNTAFAKIMRTARLASFNEEFWMIRNPQGQLRWGWGASGSGPSPKVAPRAWTSKVVSNKATGSYCLLWTNISSAEKGKQPSPSRSTGLSRLRAACVKVIH